MAVSFVGSATGSSASATTVTANNPGSSTDFGLAIWECDGFATVTAPAGWTQLDTVQLNPDTSTVYVFYRATLGVSASFTFTNSTSLNAGLAILAWSGVDATTPLDGVTFTRTVTNTGTASPFSVPAPTITPATAGACVVYIAAGDPSTNSVSGSFTQPTGYASRLFFTDTSKWAMIGVADKNPQTGATGTATGVLTRTATNFGGVGYQLVLRPGAVTAIESGLFMGNPTLLM